MYDMLKMRQNLKETKKKTECYFLMLPFQKSWKLSFKLIYVGKMNKNTYSSGVFDLFFPLKYSGSALLSIACMLKEKRNKSNHQKIPNL